MPKYGKYLPIEVIPHLLVFPVLQELDFVEIRIFVVLAPVFSLLLGVQVDLVLVSVIEDARVELHHCLDFILG